MLLWLLMLPMLAFAQTFPVSGTVTQPNGAPVAFNTVTIMYPQNNGNWIVDSTFTDSMGFYAFAPISPGSQGVFLVFAACGAGDTLFYNPASTGFTVNLVCPGAGACQAAFTVGSTQGFTYNFVNQSIGGTSYLWSFGDGTSSTQVSPSHTYANPGTYTVCLTVSGANGCTDQVCNTFIVYATGGCDASFLTVAINSNTFFFQPYDTTQTGVLYSWSMGDGTTYSTPFVVHSYAVADSYQVCLAITNPATGCATSFCTTVVSGGGGGCQASFNYFLQAPSAVQFLNTSPPVGGATYHWNFGDGNTSSQTDPFHVFASPGTYQVCLVTITPACLDSFCQTITILPNTPGACSASFSYQDLGFGSVLITVDSPLVNATYLFDPGVPGSGTITGGSSFFYQYPAAGTYNPCITVIDTTVGCSATHCSTIVLTIPNSCNVFFAYAPTGVASTYQFYDSSYSTNPIVSWSWNFGDGTTSNLQNPVHTFPGIGPWQVCLTIVDSVGCSTVHCEFVFPFNLPGTYSVYGVVLTDSIIGSESIVYLIQHDSVANTLTAIDSVAAQFGFYQFWGVQPGSYLVKAALTPNDPFYSSYLPTYLGDVLTWNQATATVVTFQDVFNFPISLVQGTNNGGPAFVGGLISQGANKNGKPLEGISVLLLHSDGSAATHTETDENGEFSFSNLAYGTYLIHVEVAGKPCERWEVTLDAANPSFTFADFEVHSTFVEAIGNTTSISGQLDPASVVVFPNPAKDFVTMEMNLNDKGAKVELMNAVGMMVSSETLPAGMERHELSLRELPAGIYLLRVTTQEGSLSRQIIKE